MPEPQTYPTPSIRTSGKDAIDLEKAMTLRDQGFRFYVSPARDKAQWMLPQVKDHFNTDWVDVTNMPSDELLAYLLFKPFPHGKEQCQQVQLDIFADSQATA